MDETQHFDCYTCEHAEPHPGGVRFTCKFDWTTTTNVPPTPGHAAIKSGYNFPTDIDPTWWLNECKVHPLLLLSQNSVSEDKED